MAQICRLSKTAADLVLFRAIRISHRDLKRLLKEGPDDWRAGLVQSLTLDNVQRERKLKISQETLSNAATSFRNLTHLTITPTYRYSVSQWQYFFEESRFSLRYFATDCYFFRCMAFRIGPSQWNEPPVVQFTALKNLEMLELFAVREQHYIELDGKVEAIPPGTYHLDGNCKVEVIPLGTYHWEVYPARLKLHVVHTSLAGQIMRILSRNLEVLSLSVEEGSQAFRTDEEMNFLSRVLYLEVDETRRTTTQPVCHDYVVDRTSHIFIVSPALSILTPPRPAWTLILPKGHNICMEAKKDLERHGSE